MPGSNSCIIVYDLLVKKILGKYQDKMKGIDKMGNEIQNFRFNENKKKIEKRNKLLKAREITMDSALKAVQKVREENGENDKILNEKAE